MTSFLWTIAVILGVDALSKILHMALGRVIVLKPLGMALDVVLNISLITWAVVLLSRSA